MHEHQSDDFFIPAFLLKLPQESGTDRREKLRFNWSEHSNEDFLKGLQGWTEYLPLDECVE